MMDTVKPIVYLLHGNDEFSIKQFLLKLKEKVGETPSAAMNITVLDEGNFQPESFLSIAAAMPFLAERRLVVVHNPLSQLKNPEIQNKFLEQLELIPPTTALVLIEYHSLSNKKNEQQPHWLLDYATKSDQRFYCKEFTLPKGQAMIQWIMEKAREEGGAISHRAAYYLGELVEGDTRLATQEIKKLLAFADYQRPIDVDDVELLTADVNQGDVFKFVDLLGSRNRRAAIGMLERLLERQDSLLLFGMVIRQFRFLLQTREAIDQGKGAPEISRKLGIHNFIAKKIISQVKYFSMEVLESIYRRLLEMDVSIKTGEISVRLALETLVVVLSDPDRS